MRAGRQKVGRPKGGCNIQKAEKTRFVELVRQVGFINIASQLMGYTGNAFRYHMEQDEAFANSVNAAWAEWNWACPPRWKSPAAKP